MSGILGVFGTAQNAAPEAITRRMANRVRARGRDRWATWSAGGAALAVTRHAWELRDGLSGNALVVTDGDWIIAADASLYYQQELRDKLTKRDVGTVGETPSHLILAAYRAWGDRCVDYLEGDYAFIVYDRRSRRVFCARDFGGRRPLYFAKCADTLILASTLSGILAHPDCPQDLNLLHIAETAAVLWTSPHETAYSAISLIPAGWTLSWSGVGEPRLCQEWCPPEIGLGQGLPFEEGAVELRQLLCRAVEERLAPKGVTTVWMSGGWDSTAVFGAGEKVLLDRGLRQQDLRPVSISYPPGDPGHEDEFISAIAERWESPIQWLDIRDIPLLDKPSERGAARDEPFAQAYELWNRALARGSRTLGARIALDGNGGDQLFQVTPVYLADLLREGRWIRLAQEWRAGGGGGLVNFLRWAVKPALGPSALDLATALRRGRRVHGPYERWMPSWLNKRLVGLLAERQKLHAPPRRDMSCAAYETRFFLSCPAILRGGAAIAGYALEEGIEVRSPLYDGRVIAFAASRPWQERHSRGETKRLLRRAMKGLLPDHVLAPRPYRTGVTTKYFERAARSSFPKLFQGVSDSWALAGLGIVDAAELARACQDYLQTGDGDVGLALLYTLNAEYWLRARLRCDGAVEDVGRKLTSADRAVASGAYA